MSVEKTYYQKNIELNQHDALIIVDLQNDFMPGGALPVDEGDQIIDNAFNMKKLNELKLAEAPSQIITLPKVGHCSQMERPSEYYRVIREILGLGD